MRAKCYVAPHVMQRQVPAPVEMPEGPEVFHLGLLVNAAGIPARTHGKHLFVYGQDWSFGLTGRVAFDGTTLTKVRAGRIYGGVEEEEAAGSSHRRLGVDFATGSQAEMAAVVRDVFMGSRKQLGALLLDQSHIAGIGVAWGSEVLHAAGGLDPSLSAKEQDLRGLASAMCAVRDAALAVYGSKVRSDPTADINGWFGNLYAVRTMKVYGCGTPVTTGGRTWWT